MRIGFEQLGEKIIQVNGFKTHEIKYEYTMEQIHKDVHCSSVSGENIRNSLNIRQGNDQTNSG